MAGDLSPAEVLLERVEMVDFSTGFEQPAGWVWRVILSGYCADFETETAATNFRNAIARLLTAARAEGAAGSVGVGDITTDGPYPPSDSRRWLARKLLDSQLSDEEAFEIVSFHPCIKAPLRTEEPPVGGGEG